MNQHGLLKNNYARLQEGIEIACSRALRKRSEITLVAMSKCHSADAVLTIANEGQQDFGENYIQEYAKKKDDPAIMQKNICWHMTGHLQTRKARLAAGCFKLIHTIDSIKLAKELEKQLVFKNNIQDALIEVNLACEKQKTGILPYELNKTACQILKECPHLKIKGLMCIPPAEDSKKAAGTWFAQLRTLRNNMEKETGIAFPELSMGMSDDYEYAIYEGATIIRIGTAIFGSRNLHK